MKIIVTIVPTNLVANLFLSLFHSALETEFKNQDSQPTVLRNYNVIIT